MGKNINQDTITIKRLITRGMKQADIARLLGLHVKKLVIGQKKIIQQKKREEKN